MKEITVTFENGGVFNGSANSFTLDNLITYYFTIDKNYRVQVNASTMAIELQEYQNTNGAWYNINIIASVVIAEIQTGGGGDVTKEYLAENYYTKQETDDKYVKKTGDTMSGPLILEYNGYKLSISSDTINIDSEAIKLLQLYRNNVNVYQGGVYIRSGGTGSSSAVSLNVNGLYIYGNDNDTIGYFSQENSRGNTAIHIFNQSRIVLHSGEPATTEPYIELKQSGITGANGSLLNVYLDTVFYSYLTCNSRLTTNSTVNINNGLTSRGNIVVTGSAGTATIYPNNYAVQSNNNSIAMYANAIYMYSNSVLDVAIRTTRGIDVYNAGSLIIHGGTGDKQTAYTYLGFDTYNLDSNDTWHMYMGGARFEMANAYSLIMYSNSLARIQAGTELTLADSGGYITIKNVVQALNNAFYGEEFLNALNQVLLFIFNKIGATTYYEFPSQNYGGGFAAGGGSSRGGGVGRR